MTTMTSEDANATPVEGYAFSTVYYRCITPLHVGCGQDVGVVDLPVIRERTTGYPIIPGSGIRGTIRDVCERKAPAMAPRLFGTEINESAEKVDRAGCVIVNDARILLFPVRSHPGVFHWITCPFVLTRYAADAEYFGRSASPFGVLPDPGEDAYAGKTAHTPLVLEELPFDRASEWEFPLSIDGVDSAKVVMVSDDVFHYFVRHATVVTQHNHLSAAKTVMEGQLFSVEAVPPEAVFYGFLGATDERVEENGLSMTEVGAELRKALIRNEARQNTAVILGGHEGTGLGLTRVIWA